MAARTAGAAGRVFRGSSRCFGRQPPPSFVLASEWRFSPRWIGSGTWIAKRTAKATCQAGGASRFWVKTFFFFFFKLPQEVWTPFRFYAPWRQKMFGRKKKEKKSTSRSFIVKGARTVQKKNSRTQRRTYLSILTRTMRFFLSPTLSVWCSWPANPNSALVGGRKKKRNSLEKELFDRLTAVNGSNEEERKNPPKWKRFNAPYLTAAENQKETRSQWPNIVEFFWEKKPIVVAAP